MVCRLLSPREAGSTIMLTSAPREKYPPTFCSTLPRLSRGENRWNASKSRMTTT
jgi:hypothetical protein